MGGQDQRVRATWFPKENLCRASCSWRHHGVMNIISPDRTYGPITGTMGSFVQNAQLTCYSLHHLLSLSEHPFASSVSSIGKIPRRRSRRAAPQSDKRELRGVISRAPSEGRPPPQRELCGESRSNSVSLASTVAVNFPAIGIRSVLFHTFRAAALPCFQPI